MVRVGSDKKMSGFATLLFRSIIFNKLYRYELLVFYFNICKVSTKKIVVLPVPEVVKMLTQKSVFSLPAFFIVELC